MKENGSLRVFATTLDRGEALRKRGTGWRGIAEEDGDDGV